METRVTKEFKRAFDFCMAYYECTEEEIAYEKNRIRANYEQAAQCYLAIAETLGKLAA